MLVSICEDQVVTGGTNVQSGFNGTPTPSNTMSTGSPQLGNPSVLVVSISSSASITATIFVSYDNENWVAATIDGQASAASLTIGAGAGQAVKITPAPFVRVAINNTSTLTVQAYTA